MEKVKIVKMGINGEGIAYVNHKPIFIKGAFPNETAEIEITEENERYTKAISTNILEESNDRRKPLCPHAETCGACSLSAMDHKAQCHWKKELLVEALEKYGNVSRDLVREVHSDHRERGYRTQCKMPVQTTEGKLVSGLYEAGTNHFHPVDNCIVQDETLEKTRLAILNILNKAGFPSYNQKTKSGLRYIVVRTLNGKSQCTLITGKDIIKEEALRSGSFYVVNRWLGGTLTNFKTIQKRIRYLNDLISMEEDGSIETYSKKDIVKLRKEKEKLLKNLEGIAEMRKVPNAVIVVDPKLEHNAVDEAKKLNIPVFGLLDTNADPAELTYGVPANDDGVKSVQLICGVLADAIVEAKGGSLMYAYNVASEDELSMQDALNSVDKVEELKLIRQIAREDAQSSKKKSSRKRVFKKPAPKAEEAKPAPKKAPRKAKPAAEETKETK